MKTDRFADSIRRKLESIRPEFTDKDWARMQNSLHQANLSQPGDAPTGNLFGGGVWVSKSWLLAAASISTVALIALSVWQRREITDLRQTISQLNQQKIQSVAPSQSGQTSSKNTRPDVTYSANGQSTVNPGVQAPSENRADQLPRPDTVYITRYVAAPSPSRPVPPDEQPPGQHVDSPADQCYATTERTPVSSVTPNQPINLNKTQKIDTYGAISTSPAIEKNIHNPSITASMYTPKGNKIRSVAGQQVETGVVTPTTSGNRTDNSVTGPVTPQTNSSGQQLNQSSATFELLSSLPLNTPSANWQGLLIQRAKRMRMAQPTLIMEEVVAKAPASQPIQQPPMRFRAGAAGEVEAHMWSTGVYSEMPLSKYWVLGLGLSRATYLGGTFLTDDDFNTRTHRDFRKEFARGMVPPQDILNIDTRIIRLQIPINLGYRFPLSRAFTLVPAVGTYLNLSNTEKVTFYYRDLPQRGFDQANFSDNRPADLLDSFTLSTGIEWQGGRWVIQGQPVITVPLQSNLTSTPDPRWQTSTTIGFRARLMYQF